MGKRIAQIGEFGKELGGAYRDSNCGVSLLEGFVTPISDTQHEKIGVTNPSNKMFPGPLNASGSVYRIIYSKAYSYLDTTVPQTFSLRS